MPFVTTQDGTEIYYKDWGTGVPVILIHGWPLNSDMWEYQAPYLAANGMRVISYDRRGFGLSSQPWNGYDYDTFASDLNTLIESLEVPKVSLVGFSMGGGEVARYCSLYGVGRVSRAVLMSAVTPFLLKTEDNGDGVGASVFEDIAKNLGKDRPAFLKEFGPKFYGRTAFKHTVSEPVLEWTQTMAMAASPRATMAAMRAWSTTDFRSDLAAVTVPTLVIHGTNDATVPIDIAGRKSVKLLPNATMSEYDGEPHGLFATAPQRLNEELLAFLGDPRPVLTPPELS